MMATPPAFEPDPGMGLLGLYDVALPQVYGYLLPRCGSRTLAEDLTAESFLAAVAATRKPDPPALSIPWLIGVARHKLVDHWRRREREERNLQLAYDSDPVSDDPWDERLDALRARDVLASLGPHHRAALTLRYADGLPVLRGRRAPRPHGARHRGVAGARPPGISRELRGWRGGRRCLTPSMSWELPSSRSIPDPAFAARLRTQLQDALLSTVNPRGGGPPMSDIRASRD